MIMSKKSEVVITLDDSGNVAVNFTSKNLLTVLGMIEMGKNIIQYENFKASMKSEMLPKESPIIKPDKRIIL